MPTPLTLQLTQSLLTPRTSTPLPEAQSPRQPTGRFEQTLRDASAERDLQSQRVDFAQNESAKTSNETMESRASSSEQQPGSSGEAADSAVTSGESETDPTPDNATSGEETVGEPVVSEPVVAGDDEGSVTPIEASAAAVTPLDALNPVAGGRQQQTSTNLTAASGQQPVVVQPVENPSIDPQRQQPDSQPQAPEKQTNVAPATDTQRVPETVTTAASQQQASEPIEQGHLPRPLAGETKSNRPNNQSPAGSADVIDQRGPATSQQAPTLTDASSLEQAPTRSPETVRTDSVTSVNRSDDSGDLTAATGRAAQVDQAVRLENATGVAPATATTTTTRPMLETIGGATQDARVAGTGQLPLNEVDDGRFAGRILRGVNTMVNQRGGVMTMRLDPPDLGQLRIQMTMVQGAVTASFQVASSEAQSLLERNIGTLRSSLEGHGLTVERLTVTTQASNSQSGGGESSSQQDSTGQNKQDAAQEQSRGRGREQFGRSTQRHGSFESHFEQSADDATDQPTSQRVA